MKPPRPVPFGAWRVEIQGGERLLEPAKHRHHALSIERPTPESVERIAGEEQDLMDQGAGIDRVGEAAAGAGVRTVVEGALVMVDRLVDDGATVMRGA
jgi:hypothetical protein